MDRETLLIQTRVNLENRAKIILSCKKDNEQKSLHYEMCRRDILYFFENFVYTIRDQNFYPAEFGNDVPFILFDFQKDFVTGLWDSIQEASLPVAMRMNPTDVFIEKSRQMGLSWLTSAVFIYGFIFHNHRYLALSQKEDLVDKVGDMKSLFEKMRYMIKMLPNWMLPKGLTKEMGSTTNKYMSLARSDGPGSITGESANQDASRGGTFNAILIDEMASMANAGKVNTAASRATACRIFNSTPAGKGNEFYRIRKRGEIAMRDETTMPFKWFRIHWSEHPFYDKAWYDMQCARDTPETIAQELDISYNTSIIGRVYPEYTGETYDDIKYDESLPLFIAIDNSHGGADPHAVILCQIDGNNWNIIDYMEVNCSVTDIALLLAKKPNMAMNNTVMEFYERYKRYKKATFVSDPYDTYATLNTSTIAKEYSKVGIYLNTPIERKKDHQILSTRNNIHRFRIADQAIDLATAIANSRYPERAEESNSTSERKLPVHDQFSHGRSALEYLVSFLLETDLTNKPKHIYSVEEIPAESPMAKNFFQNQDPYLTTGYYEQNYG